MGKKSTADADTKKGAVETTKQVIEQEGFLEVSRTMPGMPVETKREKIKIRPFVTTPATVSVKMGATVQPKDFNSIRWDVMMSVPCYVEEMVDVFQDLKKTVEGLADQLANEITSDVKNESAAPAVKENGQGANLDDLL